MSTFFISYHQKRVVKYQRVLAKLEHQSKEYATTAIETTPVPLAISKEILEAVQLKLHAFETQKLFLNQELSLSSLAKLLGTNSSYLSKIINHTKGKSFKHYLNDMRIDHAYYDLKAHPKKRKFTIEAIAFDNGFKSAESFSKKFKERFEIYPSVFLKSLAS
jgi:AraC-like DNA-binding protein